MTPRGDEIKREVISVSFVEANRDTNEKTARSLLKNAKAVRNSITSCWCKENLVLESSN